MNAGLIPRLAAPATKHFFLFGPRGTGKSTWLRETFAHAAWVDLLEAATYRTYLAQPERLEDFVRAHAARGTVVIDEVQRVPQLLAVVHRLMEQRQELRFVLTGSSARKLRQGGVDLLAGRAVVRNLHPFLAAELGPAFSLERALRLGTLPLVGVPPTRRIPCAATFSCTWTRRSRRRDWCAISTSLCASWRS